MVSGGRPRQTVRNTREPDVERARYSSVAHANGARVVGVWRTGDGQGAIDTREVASPKNTAQARSPVPDCADRNRPTGLAADSSARGVLVLGLARRHPGCHGMG